MKNFIIIIAFVFGVLTSSAQPPQAFSYQSVIRDGSGELVANQQVGIQISILQGSASGTAVYTETHSPTTNVNGLASLNIGEGNASNGVFASINWGNGPYFVETSTDPAGGNNYSISSVSQLLSVPYALYAENALSVEFYNAVFPSDIPYTGGGGTQFFLDFTNILQNSNSEVFERLPTGEIQIKKSGMLTIHVELLASASGGGGGANTLVRINGNEVSRYNQTVPNNGNYNFPTSCVLEVDAGDLLQVEFFGSSSINFLWRQLFNKLNMQWIGILD